MDCKFKTAAIILAAGLGTRMKSDTTKQKMQICGKSVLFRTVKAFERASFVDGIVVVCREEEREFAKNELSEFLKIKAIVTGGKERSDSAKNGFLACDGFDFVAVHDAARCMITPSEIDKVISAAHSFGAASAVRRVNDTVKLVNGDSVIEKTVPRESLRFAETPQVFSYRIYEKALGANAKNRVTDDNMMAEMIGAEIKAVEIDCYNFKITTHADIEYAQFLVEKGYAE